VGWGGVGGGVRGLGGGPGFLPCSGDEWSMLQAYQALTMMQQAPKAWSACLFKHNSLHMLLGSGVLFGL